LVAAVGSEHTAPTKKEKENFKRNGKY